MTTPIPQPPGVPLLGNIFDVDPNNTWWSLKALAEKYGECALGRTALCTSIHVAMRPVC